MKNYIIATINMPMEKGTRTPVLNKSNFTSLLTPGGKVAKLGHI
jgi:hypothetical protein